MLLATGFGDGWKEFSPGARYTPTEKSCGFQPGGPEDALLAGAALAGPTVQFGDQPGYVSSRVYAFPSEADALAWVEIARSEAWGECQVRALQKFQDENNAEVAIRLESRQIDTLGESGFEAYAQFLGENDAGEVVYESTVSMYRLQRTVIVTTRENGGVGDEGQRFSDGEFAALSSAYDRVNALG